MLELWHVTKRFGGLTAVGDVSFKIKKGEIYALIGPNGAGKTTIFNLITGVYALTEGRVIFDGTVVGQGDAIIKDDMRETDVKPFRKQPYDIMSRGMARTFQNIRLFKSETVYNNVLTACHAEADYNIFQSLWRLKVGPKWLTKYYYQEKALREKTEELLKIMGIWEQRDMIAALKRAGVDVEKQLKMANLSSEFFKKNTSVATAKYQLQLGSSAMVAKVWQALDGLGISNVSILKVSHSKIEQYKAEVRVEAMQNARQSAATLAEAIGQKIGKCFYIYDSNNNVMPVFYDNMAVMRSAKAMGVAEDAAADEPLDFKTIKLQYNVQAKFVLE